MTKSYNNKVKNQYEVKKDVNIFELLSEIVVSSLNVLSGKY